MSKNDGGPAFGYGVMPDPDDDMKAVPVAHLAVRDWFAGQALIGIAFNRGVKAYDTSSPRAYDWMVKQAYDLADAMLKARGES